MEENGSLAFFVLLWTHTTKELSVSLTVILNYQSYYQDG